MVNFNGDPKFLGERKISRRGKSPEIGRQFQMGPKFVWRNESFPMEQKF